MNITEEKKVEDCFDGSTVFSCRFDAPFDRERIQTLRGLGELDYFPDFPRPFFRVRDPGGFQIKGVEGEYECQVIYPKEGKEVLRIRWLEWARASA